LTEQHLEKLSDFVTEAHTRIQEDFKDINPVVGLSRKMRSVGIPADAITIDCLKTSKRIILILHDQQPDIVHYQFSFKDKDPDEKFETLEFKNLSAEQLYRWIIDYFSDL